MNKFIEFLQQDRRGQSLVESALVFPILILLLGGIVEVSNLLVTQNRVSAATREANGFVAARFRGAEWDDSVAWSSAVGNVATQNVTETLDLDPVRWDIWAIKATLNEDGTAFTEWNPQHAYGNHQVVTTAEWAGLEPQVQNDVLAAIQGSAAGADDLEFVATVSYHNRRSMLGLNAFDLGDFTRIQALNVMRVDQDEYEEASCNLFPISLYYQNESLYPESFAADPNVNPDFVYNSAIGNNGWDYPASDLDTHYGPYNSYDDDAGFPLAVGGHSLGELQRGDIVHAWEGFGPGNFGWLTWSGDPNEPALEASLTYPGNLANTNPPEAGEVLYSNPDDPADWIISIGDWVQGSTGNMSSSGVTTELAYLIDNEIAVVLLVFDDVRASGSNFDYHTAAFLKFRLLAYNNGGTPESRYILLEYLGPPGDCAAGHGQPAS